MKNRVKFQSRWKFIKMFMFRYIVVMLLPVIIISIIYYNCLKIIEQDTIESNISVLDKTRSMLESRIDEINSLIRQIAWDNKINRFKFIREPFKGPNVYKILETRYQLYDYSLINSFVIDYYVLYLDSGIVMGPDQTYLLDKFYGYFLSYQGVEYDDWIKEISGDYRRGAFISERQALFKGNPCKLLTYMKDLGPTPIGRRSKVMFLLNGDIIRSLLDGFGLLKEGYAYIADESGNVITVFPSRIDIIPTDIDISKTEGYHIKNINGENMLLTYVISQNTGWSYVVAQPYKNVMEKVSNIKKISFGIFAGAIILGLVLAFLWSNRSSVPIKKTFELICQLDGLNYQYKDPFEYIQHSVHKIIRNNESLSRIIEQQVSFLRTSFYQQLINGDFSSEEELYNYANYIGLDIDGAAYAASIVQILGYEQVKAKADREVMKELDMRRFMVKEVLLRSGFTKIHLYDITSDRILIVLVLENDDYQFYREQMKSYVKRVRDELIRDADIEIQFALDELCSRFFDLTNSIQHELQILDLARINEECTCEIWCEDIIEKQHGIFYPKELEYKIINNAKDGNEERVADTLKNLQIENFIRRKLTPVMSKVFLNQLYGTLLRVMQEVSIEDEEIYQFGDSLNSQNDIYRLYDDSFSFIVNSFIRICRVITAGKKNRSMRLMSEIREFIQRNYADNNLSLSVLADKFNYSPAYLSLFFKEQMGNNFSDYLEEVRMNHAEDLLMNSFMSVSEIAEAVGYNSANTFCRAFRRIYGMSPGQYRRLQTRRVGS